MEKKIAIEVKAMNTRKHFICTNKDNIMFNGLCYQLITQSFHKDWCDIAPVISKAEFNRLMKLGVLSKPYVVKRTIEVMMYDFNIKKV